MTDEAQGAELSQKFLALCQQEGATGTALLNAMGNALVGFFMVTPFDSHEDRMKEVDHWCAALRGQIVEANRRGSH